MREEQQQEERTVTLRDCSLADSTRSIQSANWSNLCLRDLVCSRAWMRGWYAGRSLIDGRDLIAFHWYGFCTGEPAADPSEASDKELGSGLALPRDSGSCQLRDGVPGREPPSEPKLNPDAERFIFFICHVALTSLLMPSLRRAKSSGTKRRLSANVSEVPEGTRSRACDELDGRMVRACLRFGSGCKKAWTAGKEGGAAAARLKPPVCGSHSNACSEYGVFVRPDVICLRRRIRLFSTALCGSGLVYACVY